MHPITRSNTVKGTHNNERTWDAARLSTSSQLLAARERRCPERQSPAPAPGGQWCGSPSPTAPCPACRMRANIELNCWPSLSASKIAPRPAGTTSKIKSSNWPCSSLRSRIACTMRLIFSSAFRFRATREVCGQLAQQPLRLQINHVPGMDDGGLRRELRLLELHPARRRRRACSSCSRNRKEESPGGDLVSMLQPLLFDPGAVHQGSVAAVEVPHPESSVLPAHAGNVFARPKGR